MGNKNPIEIITKLEHLVAKDDLSAIVHTPYCNITNKHIVI